MSDDRTDVVSVDMVRCAGHGICALIFPDRVALDEWGFAKVDPTPVAARRSRKRALRAARACPRQALLLNGLPLEGGRPTVGS